LMEDVYWHTQDKMRDMLRRQSGAVAMAPLQLVS
jgi:hypothetical protein